MSAVWLTAWVLLNGDWIHGDNYAEWKSQKMDSVEQCQEYQAKVTDYYGYYYNNMKFTCEVGPLADAV